MTDDLFQVFADDLLLFMFSDSKLENKDGRHVSLAPRWPVAVQLISLSSSMLADGQTRFDDDATPWLFSFTDDVTSEGGGDDGKAPHLSR